MFVGSKGKGVDEGRRRRRDAMEMKEPVRPTPAELRE